MGGYYFDLVALFLDFSEFYSVPFFAKWMVVRVFEGSSLVYCDS